MRTHRHIAIAFLLLGAACTNGPATPTLAELVDRNVAARGGRAAIEAVHSIEYDLAIEEPTFSVDARYRAERGGRVRVDVYADGERVYSEGFDGEHGWEMGRLATEAEAISAAGEAALRRGVESPDQLFGLHEVEGLGHRLVLTGRESIDDIRYHVVELTFADGTAVDYYLHPETFLIERKRETRPLHPDVLPEPVRMETRWSDCRPVDAIVRCLEENTTNLDTGEWMQRVRVTRIVHDPALAQDAFARPGVP